MRCLVPEITCVTLTVPSLLGPRLHHQELIPLDAANQRGAEKAWTTIFGIGTGTLRGYFATPAWLARLAPALSDQTAAAQASEGPLLASPCRRAPAERIAIGRHSRPPLPLSPVPPVPARAFRAGQYSPWIHYCELISHFVFLSPLASLAVSPLANGDTLGDIKTAQPAPGLVHKKPTLPDSRASSLVSRSSKSSTSDPTPPNFGHFILFPQLSCPPQ